MSKPFFYRIEAADFFTITNSFTSDKELGKFIRQFSVDLITKSGNSDYAKKVIMEATEYIDKKRRAGKKGGEQKSSSARPMLKQCLTDANSITLARSSNRSSTEENNLSPNKKSPVYSTPFLEFWNKYPKKVGKGSAWIEWQKHVTPADVDKIMDALEWQTLSPDWTKEGGIYVVDPERYIKRRRWEDERSTAPRAPQYPPNMGLPPGMVY